ASAAAADFITRIGRRKLIIPVYEALVETAPGLALARATFELARPGYHPITTASVAKVIDEANPPPAPAAPAAGDADAEDNTGEATDDGSAARPDPAAGAPKPTTG